MAIHQILVVDDSPTDLSNIKDIVVDTGCAVLTAGKGQEAIDVVKTEKPGLIFLDIVMPSQDGFSTCRELAKDIDTKAIPVVFGTSKDQKANWVRAQMQGVEGDLTKPYSAHEMVDQLKALQ